jgi:hypothetical protein
VFPRLLQFFFARAFLRASSFASLSWFAIC